MPGPRFLQIRKVRVDSMNVHSATGQGLFVLEAAEGTADFNHEAQESSWAERLQEDGARGSQLDTPGAAPDLTERLRVDEAGRTSWTHQKQQPIRQQSVYGPKRQGQLEKTHQTKRRN